MKSFASTMDITLRVLLIGQASFLLAFLFTNAMKYCARDTSALRVEAQWGLLIALADLVIVPLMLIWRLCLDGTPSRGIADMRRIQRLEREAEYKRKKDVQYEEEQKLLEFDEDDMDSDGNFNLHLKEVENEIIEGGRKPIGTPREKVYKDDSYMDIDMFNGDGTPGRKRTQKRGANGKQGKRQPFKDFRKSPFYDEELGGVKYSSCNLETQK